MRAARMWIVIVATCAAPLLACSDDTPETEADLSSHDFDAEECGACGMIVREQPAPRAQLVHRDGTRVFFCSVADLLSYLDAPSPHGSAESIYVESLDPDADDPVAHDLARRPWIPADEAFYVTHVTRPRVMGVPVLAYAHRADAERIAERLGGRVHDWLTLRAAVQEERGAEGSPPHSLRRIGNDTESADHRDPRHRPALGVR